MNAAALSIAFLIALDAAQLFRPLPAFTNEGNSPKLPSNVFMSECMKPALKDLWRRSPTFRRQCRQIDAARHLRITVLLSPSLPNGYRSPSKIRKTKNGLIIITVQIDVKSDYAEMMGHEFEHALEQVQGIELKEFAKSKESAVYQQRDGAFETERAIKAGRITAYEFYSFREPKR